MKKKIWLSKTVLLCAHCAHESWGFLSEWCENCRGDKWMASPLCGFCSASWSCSCEERFCHSKGRTHPVLVGGLTAGATQTIHPTRQIHHLTKVIPHSILEHNTANIYQLELHSLPEPINQFPLKKVHCSLKNTKLPSPFPKKK